MPRGLDDQGNNNWHCLWEEKRKSRLKAARAWLQRLSSSLASLRTLSIPFFTPNSPEAVSMSTNPMIESLEDQFLHWRQDMERKQEEQAGQMKELQVHAKRLQQENN